MTGGEAVEEQALCRVCHESHGVLYYPCKCSGSIRHVHQDCLITWLRISKQSHGDAKCELCGSRFVFRRVYKTGGTDPPRLSVFEFFGGLIPRVIDFVRELSRVSTTTFFWLFCLPIMVSWFVDLSTSFVLVGHIHGVQLLPRRVGALASSWWNGLLITLFIAFSSITMLQFAAALQQEFMRVNTNLRQTRRAQATAAASEAAARAAAARVTVQEQIARGLADGIDAEEEEEKNEDESSGNSLPHEAHALDRSIAEEEQRSAQEIERDERIAELENEIELAQGALAEAQRVAREDEAAAQAIGPLGFAPPILAPLLMGGHDPAAVQLRGAGAGPHIELTFELWIASVLYLSLFILVLHVAPIFCGRACLSALRIDPNIYEPTFSAWGSAQLLVHRLRAEELHIQYFGVPLPSLDLTADFLWPRLVLVLEGFVGFAAIVCVGFCLATSYIVVCHRGAMSRILEVIEAQCTALWTTARSWIAVSSFLLYDGGVLPQLLGWLIGISTLKAFETSLSSRIELCTSVPVICTIAHWVVGFFFMLHLNVVLSELRGMLRPDLLVDVLLPREIDDQALDHLALQPPLALLRRALVNTCVYLPGVVFTVLLPATVGHWVSPCSRPLRLRFNEVVFDVQLPMEMLVFHIMVPVALERMRHRAVVRVLLEVFLRRACKVLGLEELLDPVFRRGGWRGEERGLGDEEGLVDGEGDWMGLGEAAEAEEEEEEEEEDVGAAEIGEDEREHLSVAGEGGGGGGGGGALSEAGGSGQEVGDEEEKEKEEEEVELEEDFKDDLAQQRLSQRTRGVCAQGPAHSSRINYSSGNSSSSSSSSAPPRPVPLSVRLKRLPHPVRVGLLILTGVLSLTVASSWLLHVPLVVGKAMLRTLRLSVQHDLYSLSAGFCVCWIGGASLRFIARDVVLNTEGLTRSALRWLWAATKLMFLSTLWLTVPPLLTGLLLEAIVVVPLRTPLNETARYPLVQCWAVGLVMLKVWTRCLVVGALGDNPYRAEIERLLQQGAANIDLWAALRNLVFPISATLLDLLATPYFIARVLGALFFTCYATQTLLVRYSFAAYFFLYVAAFAFGALHDQFKRIYNEIRDSHYLVGTELANSGGPVSALIAKAVDDAAFQGSAGGESSERVVEAASEGVETEPALEPEPMPESGISNGLASQN